jgi:hypothetical protein
MEKLALPTKPTRFAIVEVPKNSVLRKSTAGPQEWSSGQKQQGGGIQYELSNYPNEWFKDLISIEDFFK